MVGEWISVEDRLPDETGAYLCATLDVAENLTDIFIHSFWLIEHRESRNKFSCKSYQKVTHWMPLPKPPTTEQLNDDAD